MAARVYVFGPEIFKFCTPKAVEDPGMVRFLKFGTYLHRFEGEGRDCRSFWPCVEVRVSSDELDFQGFVNRSPFKVLVGSIL